MGAHKHNGQNGKYPMSMSLPSLDQMEDDVRKCLGNWTAGHVAWLNHKLNKVYVDMQTLEKKDHEIGQQWHKPRSGLVVK